MEGIQNEANERIFIFIITFVCMHWPNNIVPDNKIKKNSKMNRNVLKHTHKKKKKKKKNAI